MGEDQRPRGEFGLPRLSDIGPRVSAHNSPPTDCDIEVAYNGLTKKEAAEEVLSAYKIAHGIAFDNLPKEPEGVFLVGSTVSGDFGCRSMPKIKEEAAFIFSELIQKPDDIEIIDELILNSDSALEIYTKFKNREDEFVGNVEVLETDLFEVIVSDIDIVSAYNIHREVTNDLQHGREYREVIDNINARIFDDTDVNMSPSFGIRGQDFLDDIGLGPTVTSPQEYKEIIDKYYE